MDKLFCAVRNSDLEMAFMCKDQRKVKETATEAWPEATWANQVGKTAQC